MCKINEGSKPVKICRQLLCQMILSLIDLGQVFNVTEEEDKSQDALRNLNVEPKIN